jgi:hypothetical protein
VLPLLQFPTAKSLQGFVDLPALILFLSSTSEYLKPREGLRLRLLLLLGMAISKEKRIINKPIACGDIHTQTCHIGVEDIAGKVLKYKISEGS